ncbi:hypothetical protein AMATHDRAFT_45692 [Amanita thiersii Skay4041]|uniref:Uncharacterized protein n=1 Tax=Amanita thiersii Skay4041 TaxID=703135 RepID=A0A2A9NUK8_9AGAR|nr:hypothetical protein AMATHDRAFT_45692 [Amanita thiersii Skay4041]
MPCSGFQFRFNDFPYLLVEVISDLSTEKDRYRMLIQAATLLRLAHASVSDGTMSDGQFTLMALNIDNNLCAERYLLCKDGTTVPFIKKSFDLTRATDVIEFSLSFNSKSVIQSSINQLGYKGESIKASTNVVAKRFHSITEDKNSKPQRTEGSQSKRSERSNRQGGHQITRNPVIISTLAERGYGVDIPPDDCDWETLASASCFSLLIPFTF